MTKVTRNVAEEVTRVQLSLCDKQQLSEHEDARRRCRRNAERDKYQKNSSKNSEPLLSLLDLSEHKKLGG